MIMQTPNYEMFNPQFNGIQFAFTTETNKPDNIRCCHFSLKKKKDEELILECLDVPVVTVFNFQ